MAVDRAEWVRLFRRRIAGVVGDVGGGRDGALRPFGCCAIIMAFVRARDRFSTAGPICQQCGVSAVLTATARGDSWGVSSSQSHVPPLRICLRFWGFRRHPCSLPLSSMAPPTRVLDPFPWSRSTMTQLALEELVNGGQLTRTSDGPYPVWMVLPASDREPNPRRATSSASSTCMSVALLTVNSCNKVQLDLQADKSPVVVKGPFFPRVVNPRYRIRGTNV
jgi:hypothetical protein